jgi:hypothetical protein
MLDKYNIKNLSGYHSVEKPPKKLLEQVSDIIRLKHYSYCYKEVKTTMICTHVLNRGGRGVRSPLDSLE